jgi:hypothetical protein
LKLREKRRKKTKEKLLNMSEKKQKPFSIVKIELINEEKIPLKEL